MKLVSLQTGDGLRVGLLEGDRIHLLADPPPVERPRSPVRRLLEVSGGDWNELDRWRDGHSLPLEGAHLAAPVPDPSYVGEVDRMTWLDVADAGEALRRFAPFRTLPDSALNHPGGTFVLPFASRRIHVNVQLGCVLGRVVSHDHPLDETAVFGYTVLVSCRQFGFEEAVETPLALRDLRCAEMWYSRWLDGSHPVGPWIVPATEIVRDDLTLSVRVEGVGAIEGSSEKMVNTSLETLAQITPIFDFFPGDIVGMGFVVEDLVLPDHITENTQVTAAISSIGELTFWIEDHRAPNDPTSRYRRVFRPEVARALEDRQRRLGATRTERPVS